jgi:monovalent cation/hydrogen antiporter
LFISRRSSTLFSPGVRLQTWAVWDALEFLLNGLVFVLIGLQLPYVMDGIHGHSHMSLFRYALVFSATLVLLRLAWMYPATGATWWVRTHFMEQIYERPKGNQAFVMGWTGMRGVVALAAANSLPLTLQDGSPFPQRSMIIFLTFSLILVTLVAQGLSLPWLVRILGLTAGNAQFCEEGEARHLILQAGIDFLGERSKSATGEHEVHIYEDLLHQYQHRLEDIDECGPGGSNPEKNSHSLTTNHLLLETIRRQRQELNLLRSNGRIGDTVHHNLERELDLKESLLT